MARRVDPKKAEAERLQKEVLDMLRDEENKYCADCGAKTPRWASWNLGVFMCIRCAGIHRNLGVHISRVKSVNLDEWTEQQVAGMRSMGNERARDAYEAKLPSDFRRPHTDSGMEQFIRAKYEHKRYSNPNFERGSGRPAYKPSPASSAAAAAPVSAPAQSANLLDFSAPPAAAAPVAAAPVQNLFDDFGSMSVSAPVAKAASAAPLDDPFASTGGDDDDPFGDFVGASVAAAPVAAAAPASVSPVSDSAGLSLGGAADLDILAPAAAAAPEEKKSLNDIMSLFGPGTAAAAPPTYAPPMQQFGGVQQQQQQQQMMGMQMGGMNGLTGLSMQGFGAPAPQQRPQMGGAMMCGVPAGMGMPQMGGMSLPGMSALPGAGFGGLPPAMAQQFAAASPFAAAGAGGAAPGLPTSAPKKDPFADLGLGSMMGGGGGVQAHRKPSPTVNAGASGGGLIDISDFL